MIEVYGPIQEGQFTSWQVVNGVKVLGEFITMKEANLYKKHLDNKKEK